MNTRVLAFLSSVAGDALTRHLSVILPAMMSALKEKLGTSEEQLASSMAQLSADRLPEDSLGLPLSTESVFPRYPGCVLSTNFFRQSLLAWWHVES